MSLVNMKRQISTPHRSRPLLTNRAETQSLYLGPGRHSQARCTDEYCHLLCTVFVSAEIGSVLYWVNSVRAFYLNVISRLLSSMEGTPLLTHLSWPLLIPPLFLDFLVVYICRYWQAIVLSVCREMNTTLCVFCDQRLLIEGIQMVLNTRVVCRGKCPYWRQHHSTVMACWLNTRALLLIIIWLFPYLMPLVPQALVCKASYRVPTGPEKSRFSPSGREKSIHLLH